MSINEILKLPVADRLQIAEQIWASLKPEKISITKAQRDELESRIVLDMEGKMRWFSVSEVKARLDNRG